eukprot:8089-Eustigmatos_ZCMA.PRE.1
MVHHSTRRFIPVRLMLGDRLRHGGHGARRGRATDLKPQGLARAAAGRQAGVGPLASHPVDHKCRTNREN